MVLASAIVAATALVLQVPAPAPADPGRDLEQARLSLLEREKHELVALAAQFDKQGDRAAAAGIRERIAPPEPADGASRFHVLPEVVPAAKPGPQAPWQKAARAIESRTTAALHDLANRAARVNPPRYALAGLCLREVLERDPDDREARRVLGYTPYQRGWARPFAASQLAKGFIDHPIFGWVGKDWVEHLDHGELPAPSKTGQKAVRWLPADQANQLRSGWNPPWQIFTEHFEIQTDVPLALAISFGRRLESFHDLFTCVMADVLGDNTPLARRLKNTAETNIPTAKPHLVLYFASKDEYVEHLIPRQGEKIARTIGFYDPPKPGKGGRAPAYFFHDPGGQLPVTATLYHEVSHQLLFENAGPNAYLKNKGNFWVYEGLGTYFESIVELSGGWLEYGGTVGRRVEEAAKSLIDEGRGVPLGQFVEFDRDDFNRDHAIYLHYQQAMAFTLFLMQSNHGLRRAPFLDYARDAYHGRIKRATGRGLDDRLGETYSSLESQYLAYLKARRPGGGPTQPTPAQAAEAGIRTVPSQ